MFSSGLKENLHDAIRGGYLSMVNSFLNTGADLNVVDDHGNSAFMIAVQHSSNLEAFAILKLLITEKTTLDIPLDAPLDWRTCNDNGHNLLMLAVMGENIDIISYIFDFANKNINTKPTIAELNNLVILAAQKQNTYIISFLVTKGANKNQALMEAALNGEELAVEFLIKNGANIHYRNTEDNTHLIMASAKGHYNIVEFLLAQEKALVNALNNASNSALTFAAHNGHARVAELLIKNGADINQENTHGQTPLYVAAENGRIEIVAMLLKNNKLSLIQDAAARNKTSTIMQIANNNGHKEIDKLLRNKLAGHFYTVLKNADLGKNTETDLKNFIKEHVLLKIDKQDIYNYLVNLAQEQFNAATNETERTNAIQILKDADQHTSVNYLSSEPKNLLSRYINTPQGTGFTAFLSGTNSGTTANIRAKIQELTLKNTLMSKNIRPFTSPMDHT